MTSVDRSEVDPYLPTEYQRIIEMTCAAAPTVLDRSPASTEIAETKVAKPLESGLPVTSINEQHHRPYTATRDFRVPRM